MDAKRLDAQLRFVLEIDKLKTVFRATWLTDGSRKENDAEHSWHFALMIPLLAEYAADAGLDLLHAVKMALVHDIVEIDAGDVIRYDFAAREAVKAREAAAADRIFALLPDDQAAELRGLWEEYEAMATPEARFAAAIDRLQPLLNNLATQGRTWQEHNIRKSQVLAANAPMGDGAPALWAWARARIEQAARDGWLIDA